MIKCVDLFSGCGGLSLGFQKAGIDVVAAIDNWDKAVDVYRENFDHECYLHDLSDVEETLKIIEKYQPSMIIGGPPCQDFSAAGKRDETLGRADMTIRFADIICSYKPEIFVMENVDRITKSSILTDVIKRFEEAGYGITKTVLDASYCNTPQSRKRFFMIGVLGGGGDIFNQILEKNLSKNPMTIRDYLGDSLGLEYYYRHPRNYNRRGIFSIDEPSPTVRGVNRPIPSGYKKHSNDPIKVDLSNIRPLTTVERSYIQTFPKNFKFIGTKTNIEQMIGNAVPVNLAEFVAKAIIEFKSSNKKEEKGQLNMFQCYNIPLPKELKSRRSLG